MEPVDPVVRDLQIRCFRAMSAERKLELAGQLLDLALELKAAGLRSLHPELPAAELRRRATRLLADVPG